VRTRGFGFLVPIGKMLTQHEEKNDVRVCWFGLSSRDAELTFVVAVMASLQLDEGTDVDESARSSHPTDDGDGDGDGDVDGDGDGTADGEDEGEEDEEGGMDLDAELEDMDDDVANTTAETEDLDDLDDVDASVLDE
jgi:hypothetical protein